MISLLHRLARDARGGPAAEFALVLPLILIFLLGIIDVGRYAWEINQAEKATQTGARWAAATDMVPTGLSTYSFATSAGIPAGNPVPASAFPDVNCASSGTTTSCSCTGCSFPTTVGTNGQAAFTNLVNRMREIKPDIAASNVAIRYSYSGLGFAGDPNGPDVAPIISVRLQNLQFVPTTLVLFGGSIALPDFSYSLTMEDGAGTTSN
ncbi:MAG: pilus assembly protein [Sphingopyxis sp.]|nr:pilus assembly protein [Sphingopyxis sp.]